MFWIELQVTMRRNTVSVIELRSHLMGSIVAFAVLRMARCACEIAQLKMGFQVCKVLCCLYLAVWVAVGLYWGVRLYRSLARSSTKKTLNSKLSGSKGRTAGRRGMRVQRGLRRFTLFMMVEVSASIRHPKGRIEQLTAADCVSSVCSLSSFIPHLS